MLAASLEQGAVVSRASLMTRLIFESFAYCDKRILRTLRARIVPGHALPFDGQPCYDA